MLSRALLLLLAARLLFSAVATHWRVPCFQEVQGQCRAMVDDTAQQQASVVKRLKEQHTAERQQMHRWRSLLMDPMSS